MTEKQIYKQAEILVKDMLATDVYANYKTALDELKKDQDLYDRVLAFRLRNFEIQENAPEDRLFEELENLEREKEEMIADHPCVEKFLSAELTLCRMIQNVSEIIGEGIHLE